MEITDPYTSGQVSGALLALGARRGNLLTLVFLCGMTAKCVLQGLMEGGSSSQTGLNKVDRPSSDVVDGRRGGEKLCDGDPVL